MLNKSDLSQIDKVVAQRIKNEIKPLKEDVCINLKGLKTLTTSLINRQ